MLIPKAGEKDAKTWKRYISDTNVILKRNSKNWGMYWGLQREVLCPHPGGFTSCLTKTKQRLQVPGLGQAAPQTISSSWDNLSSSVWSDSPTASSPPVHRPRGPSLKVLVKTEQCWTRRAPTYSHLTRTYTHPPTLRFSFPFSLPLSLRWLFSHPLIPRKYFSEDASNGKKKKE